MGRKLSPEENELYKNTDEVLHYIWDPIGIADEPSCRDEYHGYLPQVFSMLMQNKEKEEIVEFLVDVASNEMGLSANKERSKKAVEILFKWKNKIFSNTC